MLPYYVKQAAGAGNISRLLGISPKIAQLFVNFNREAAFALAKLWKMYYGWIEHPNDTEEKKLAFAQLWLTGSGSDVLSYYGARNPWPEFLANYPWAIAEVSKYQGDSPVELYKELYNSERVVKMEVDTAQVVKEFQDGFKWVALDTDQQCEEEGALMNHCGTPDMGYLVSLRDSKNRPHVTAEILEAPDGIYITQIRGKGNSKPAPKYQPYIDALYDHYGAERTPMADDQPDLTNGLTFYNNTQDWVGIGEPHYMIVHQWGQTDGESHSGIGATPEEALDELNTGAGICGGGCVAGQPNFTMDDVNRAPRQAAVNIVDEPELKSPQPTGPIAPESNAPAGEAISDHVEHPSQLTMRREGSDKPTKPQKCEWCKSDATESLVWADGRAYVPSCDKHKQATEDHINEQGEWAEIVGWRKIKASVEDVPSASKNDHLPDPEVEGDEYIKTAPVHAVEMDEEFTVETIEGPMDGKAGDYLAKGHNGDMWVVDRDMFHDTHEKAAQVVNKRCEDCGGKAKFTCYGHLVKGRMKYLCGVHAYIAVIPGALDNDLYMCQECQEEYVYFHDYVNGKPQPTLLRRQLDSGSKSDVNKQASDSNPHGFMEYHGVPIVVEWENGSTRTGKNRDGESWSRPMKAHYGYVVGTITDDGEGIDVYVGNDDTDTVYVVHQLADGKADEDKCMIGFGSEDEAEEVYRLHYPNNGDDHFGGIDSMSLNEFMTDYMAKHMKHKDKYKKKAERGQNLTSLTQGVPQGDDRLKSDHWRANESYSDENAFEDANMHMGSTEPDVRAPHSAGDGPLGDRFDDADDIIVHAQLGKGKDPYKVGRLYSYDELLEQHQHEIDINWKNRKGRKYLWLRTAMNIDALVEESRVWYDKNRNKKWKLADRERVVDLADKFMHGATVTPLLVSPPGEKNGGLWEGYHRLNALQLLDVKEVPVIMKVDIKDKHWKEKIAQKDREPWIAVDLDGTILSESEHKGDGRPPLGEPFPGVKEALQQFMDAGMRVSIWTARQYFEDDNSEDSEWQQEIDQHLKYHQIPYSDIYVGVKPPADVFIDNKAVTFDGSWPDAAAQAQQMLKQSQIKLWTIHWVKNVGYPQNADYFYVIFKSPGKREFGLKQGWYEVDKHKWPVLGRSPTPFGCKQIAEQHYQGHLEQKIETPMTASITMQAATKTVKDLYGFLKEEIPALVYNAIIGPGTIKNCSGAVDDFIAVARQSGFDAYKVSVPGHFYNIVKCSDGDVMVDLTYIQFIEASDDNKHRRRDNKLMNDIIKNPFKAIKVERIDSTGMGLLEGAKPHSLYTPVESHGHAKKRIQRIKDKKYKPYDWDYAGIMDYGSESDVSALDPIMDIKVAHDGTLSISDDAPDSYTNVDETRQDQSIQRDPAVEQTKY